MSYDPDKIDVTSRSDRVMLRKAIASGYQLEPEHLALLTRKLVEVLAVETSPREIASIGRVLTTMVGQVQADEHLDRKYEEAAAGNADSVSKIVVEYAEQAEGDDDGDVDG